MPGAAVLRQIGRAIQCFLRLAIPNEFRMAMAVRIMRRSAIPGQDFCMIVRHTASDRTPAE